MVDLRKNWVQFNDQTFQALNLMTIKSKKTEETDPVSHAIFKALETSEMLMISEYSYETTFSQRFKTQDYDLFYELVGSEEHIDSVINLHKVFFSLILGLENYISETTIEKDFGLHDKFIKVIEKLKLKADSQDLIAP